MTPETRRARRAEIAEAAFAVLTETGQGGLSMLAVARRARASNETLYRWYGDKTGLLRALIVHRASEVAAEVDAVLIGGGAAETVLEGVGTLLLEAWTEARWLALCRAAAADDTGALGQAADAAWRDLIVPRVVQLFVRLRAAGRLRGAPEAAAALWLDLLTGNWALRAVLGARLAPDRRARVARLARAAEVVLGRAA
ncbi:TetR/AcrR family transcriptional regulator [Maliponia aquimaris]|uniref:Transcriptional regulator BetI n=1 Tax=Maliponia aquimaris TaxID=1673631 RepID=A0A238KL11_9RHOB|nr:TetR/AcrR family transcriptional regulator [Maliponia aquimaris]SMX43495.1 transcriptional regulator BetI [Maliponia aquimaris]